MHTDNSIATLFNNMESAAQLIAQYVLILITSLYKNIIDNDANI
jgi:hypothetical protein